MWIRHRATGGVDVRGDESVREAFAAIVSGPIT